MFDAYHKWLGIPKDRRPPTYYDLLGIDPAEQDVEVIDGAALRQIAHVRTFQAGPQAADCARLLGELAVARRTLTSADRRAEYDARIAPAAPSPAPMPEFRLPGPGPGPESSSSPTPSSMVVTEVEPIRSRGGGASRWLAPLLTTSVISIGIALAVWQGWVPGVHLGRRPVLGRPGSGGGVVQAEPPVGPDAPPPSIAKADPVKPAPVPTPSAPVPTPQPRPAVPAIASGPISRDAVVAMLAPRPDDALPDLPDPVDPTAAFLDVTFEPADAHPRLMADYVARHALQGPGRVVEMFLKVPPMGGHATIGLSRPGFLAIQDKPVNLVPGQRVVVQVRMAPDGTPTAELVRVASRAPLAGPGPQPVASASPVSPPVQPTTPNPAPSPPAVAGRTIDGTAYTASLGRLKANSLAVSDDGQYAIVAFGDVLSFNLETGRPGTGSDGQIQNASAIAASPAGGGYLATGSGDGYVATWNTAGKKWDRSRPRPVENRRREPVRWVAYSRDGKLLAGAIDSRVTLVKPEGQYLVVGEFKLAGRFRGLAFGPDTLWIASGDKVEAYDLRGRTIKLIDQPSLGSALADGPPIVGLAAHPDGKRLFVARDQGGLQEWDLESGSLTRTLANDAGSPIAGIRLSADGGRLAAFGDTRIRVYNVETGQLEVRLVGHSAAVIGVEFLPNDPQVIVTLGSEPSLRVWDLREPGGARQRAWDPADPGSLVPDRSKKPERPGMP